MTILVFIGVNVIGNPVDILINPDLNQAERAQMVAHLGLDKPLWQQYFHFLSGLTHGDFGNSFVYSRPALDVIMERVPATLELAIFATIIAVAVGLPLGLYAGLRSEKFSAKFIMAGSILGFSLPTFWVGLMMILVFAVQLGWLPSNGRGETMGSWSFLTLDGLSYMLLPALNLALFKTSLILRLTRAGVQEVIMQDYVKFAYAKGLGEKRIIFVHILKNLMIPVITIVGLEFGSLIAYSVVTESIFGWPGMGKLIIDSINLLDRPVIVAYLMMMVVLFVSLNFIIDVCYTLLDPRVRLEGKA
ncbi:MAG TPA: ABC transporter permease [Burkholderiaceae bacterium]|nr:ABC transporter permease [Burkholderiaceae bacterium]